MISSTLVDGRSGFLLHCPGLLVPRKSFSQPIIFADGFVELQNYHRHSSITPVSWVWKVLLISLGEDLTRGIRGIWMSFPWHQRYHQCFLRPEWDGQTGCLFGDSCWNGFLLVFKDTEVHPLLDLCLSQEGGDGWGVTSTFFSMVSWGLSEDGWGKRRR